MDFIYHLQKKNIGFPRNSNHGMQLATHYLYNKPFNIHHTNFHFSSPQNASLIWIAIKPIIKLTSILLGRRFRFWWRSDPKNKKIVLTSMGKNRKWLLRSGLGLSAYAVYFYWSHLEEAPITHRKRFIAFNADQFKKIARYESEVQVALLKDKIIRTNDPSYGIVIEVLQRLFDGNRDIPGLQKLANWSVSIVKDDSMNAFILPSGQIFVFTGMLKVVQNMDQLGIILGHEMAHALLGHSVELVSYAQIVDLFIIVPLAAIWAFLPTDGIALVTQWFYQKVVNIMLQMPYSRKLEREADVVGLELSSKACFDVREAVNFWEIMEKLQREGKGNPNTPPVEWLSTHPTNIKRAQSLNELIPELCCSSSIRHSRGGKNLNAQNYLPSIPVPGLTHSNL